MGGRICICAVVTASITSCARLIEIGIINIFHFFVQKTVQKRVPPQIVFFCTRICALIVMKKKNVNGRIKWNMKYENVFFFWNGCIAKLMIIRSVKKKS